MTTVRFAPAGRAGTSSSADRRRLPLPPRRSRTSTGSPSVDSTTAKLICARVKPGTSASPRRRAGLHGAPRLVSADLGPDLVTAEGLEADRLQDMDAVDHP